MTRYFDHIQCKPPIRASAESFGETFKLLAFDFKNAPKTERKSEPAKKKEKVSKDTVPTSTQVSATESTKEASDSSTLLLSDKKGPRKDKQKAVAAEPMNSKGPSSKKGNVSKPADEGEPVPSMIDLRVGHIVDGKFLTFMPELSSSRNFQYAVIKHPDADGLYVEVFYLVHWSLNFTYTNFTESKLI